MTIPDFQTIMLPLLKFCGDNKEHSISEATENIARHFKLTDQEKEQLLDSGQQTVIKNRVGWARTYMKKAGLLEDPQRGHLLITDAGLDVLEKKVGKIDIGFLEQFPEFVEFRTIKKESSKGFSAGDKDKIEDETPDELMEKGSSLINASLAQELMKKLRTVDPYFFEEIVGRLLTKMGYGKSEVTKRSGDKGIDGVVNQDKLGLDRIFFQAKRYDENNSVTAHDVRDFVGTLDLNGVNKGVFITTSQFPKDTPNIIARTQKNIILIDGTKLAQLMIEHDVGVTTEKEYKIKRIDSDFFAED